MTTSQIRQKFLNFYQKRSHSIIPSASLIPENDPTSLFISSGMQPLVPYLAGEKHPQGRRLVNSQPCLRVEDIEEIGDGRHTTFFEMLGNWSLGDPKAKDGIGEGYFKEEQLHWWFEFLVEVLGLDINRLYSSVFEGDKVVEKDDRSVQILKDIYKRYGLRAREGDWRKDLAKGEVRIFSYSRKKNWWQRGDAIGELGGPDCETFYDTGKKHQSSFGRRCHLNCDCGRFLEIGNSVFMEYQKTKRGWKKLEQKNVDFGAGLERLAMIVQEQGTVFTIALFLPLLQRLEELAGKKYLEYPKPFEVISDHLRGAVLILAQGVVPSNVEAGYILRRLIRRALRYARFLKIEENKFLLKLAQVIIKSYQDDFLELRENQEFIFQELEREEDRFKRSLERGLRELEKLLKVKYKFKKGEFKAKDAFYIYQSYGFPLELLEEELKRYGMQIDTEKFAEEVKKHQEISRRGIEKRFRGGLADQSLKTTKLHTATHLLLSALRQVLGTVKIIQKGSNITAQRLRLDFSFPRPLTSSELKRVERLVNQKIQEDLPVKEEEMELREAYQRGIRGEFKDKYQGRVKVYSIGDFSQEICGGPHIKSTGALGRFKIIKEQSSGAGVRRIRAILGEKKES